MYVIGAERTDLPFSPAEQEFNPRPTITYLGQTAFYGTLAAILFVAVSYGTIDIWRRSLFIGFIGILGALRVLDALRCGAFKIARTSLLLPLAGVLILAVVQFSQTFAISVDPYNTEVFLVTFGGLVVTFEILSNYCNSSGRVKILVGLALIIGAGTALFGILRYWFPGVPPGFLAGNEQPEQGFGQFHNRNHFAVLLEMSFGLLLGMLITGDYSKRIKFAGSITSVVMVLGIIASSSRGGLVSLAALSAFAVFVHVMTRNGHRSEIYSRGGSFNIFTKSLIGRVVGAVGLSFLVIILVWAAIGFVGGDYLVTRVEKISEEISVNDGSKVNRNIIWQSTLEMIKDRPFLGSGFGAYAQAVPMYDKTNGKFPLEQAHNDYLELLAAGGIVGFALFLTFAVLVAVRIVKNLRTDDHDIRPLCFGASMGIFGVLIHSFVDFGLHIFVNGLIFVLLIVIATLDQNELAVKGGRTRKINLITA